MMGWVLCVLSSAFFLITHIGITTGYPYDWQRVRAAIAVAGGAVATATAVEEPVWMGKVRTVHAELSLPPPPQQPPKQEEENGGSTTPAASSSAPAASGGASGAAGALRVGTGKVWGALKAEYANGPPALPEYWQVTLFVAHMDREAAAAAVAGDGEGKEAAAAEAEG